MLKIKIVSKMTKVMARESLTRIGMRIFTNFPGGNGQHLEIPVMNGNSALSPVGERVPWVSDGKDDIGSTLGKI